MFTMVMDSAKLFFAGKLFKDNRMALRQLLIAMTIGLITGLVVGQVAPVWLAAIAAGAVAGALQPVLFKNLKYA